GVERTLADDLLEDAGRPVVLDEVGRGLLLLQARADNLRSVIFSMVQLAAVLIANAGGLRWGVLLVIERPATPADPAPSEPGDELLVADRDEEGVVYFRALRSECLVQRFGLHD